MQKYKADTTKYRRIKNPLYTSQIEINNHLQVHTLQDTHWLISKLCVISQSVIYIEHVSILNVLLLLTVHYEIRISNCQPG